MASTATDYLNLTNAGGITAPVKVGNAQSAASVYVDASSWGATTAVVDLQWSADGEDFQDFDPPVQLTGTRTAQRAVDVAGGTWLRLYVTTEAGDADADAAGTMVLLSTTRAPAERDGRQVLAQLRPSSTTAQTLYQPAAGEKVRVESILLTNQSSSGTTYRIYLDADGTTYDATTACGAWDASLPADRALTMDGLEWPLDSSGSLGIKLADANAVTITVFGRVSM